LCLQKAAKRKKIHAFKSKARFEQLEFAQNKRQNAWQQFQTTKGKTKKVSSLCPSSTNLARHYPIKLEA
jgi:hypothetical protein